jgi:hypothetical protein
MQSLDPAITSQVGATPPGSSDRIVFGLVQRQGDGYSYPGVYLLNLSTRQTSQIFGTGVHFQSASPDGKYLLVSEGSALYRTNGDGTSPLLITDSLYAFGDTDAIWLQNDQIVAVLTKSDGTEISIFSADGTLVNELPDSEAMPIDLYPNSNGDYVYWESGTCTASTVCQQDGAWVTNLVGKLNQALTGITGPALAPNGDLLVSGAASSVAQNNLVFESPDGSNPHPNLLPGNLLVDYAWSPAGDSVAAIVAIRSDYSGKVLGNRNYLIDPQTMAITEFPQSNLLNPRVLWSPDGSYLLWIGTLPNDSGYGIGAILVKRASIQVEDLGTSVGGSSQDYLTVINADWLPLP